MIRPASSPTPLAPGLLLVQVDGLSHEHLQQAIAEGRMPHLAKALEGGRLVASPLHTGLPSHTGVVQSGVLYGQATLPSNQWFDKSAGRVYNLTGSRDADHLEDTFLATGQPGLVEGGAAFLSPLSGHAADECFNLTEVARARRESGTPGVVREVIKDLARLGGRLALHPVQAVQSTAHLSMQIVRGIFERRREGVEQHFVKDRLRPAIWSSLQNGLLTDAAVLAMNRCMQKGVPVVFADLPGYDDVSHAFGPQVAMRELEAIDRNLGKLLDGATKGSRPYQVVLYSDHGQTATVGFSEIYKKTLGEVVASGIQSASSRAAQPLTSFESFAAEGTDPTEDDGLPNAHPTEGEATSEVTLVDFGSGAHIYLKASKQALDGSQVAALQPRLLPTLLQHPGLGFVVTREGAATVIQGVEGTVRVTKGQVTVEGHDPLVRYGDATRVALELHDQAHRQGAGDVMVFGGFAGDRIISFSDHHQGGTHGGPGNSQDVAFLLQEPGIGLDPQAVHNAADLYPQLRALLPPDAPAARQPS